MNRIVLSLLLVGLCTSAFAHICGTTRLMQNLHEQGNKSLDQLVPKRTQVLASDDFCKDDDLYDSVYTQTSEHFEIFYTLDGPHKTTREFIDSLTRHLEYAWKFHVNEMGMQAPLGIKSTHQFKQEVLPGLYPIEVIDIDLLRNTNTYLKGRCHGCYGLTLPFDSSQSEVLIDNDFLFTPENNLTKDFVNYNGKKCSYIIANQELVNKAHGYSYAKEWNQGLRVTTVHELYHAVQLRYISPKQFSTTPFWFEASAAGMEEVAAPDIDDYFTYLPNLSKSVGKPLDKLTEDYGAGLLFIYLYNHVNKNTDKFIWESYSKDPYEPFQYHLAQYAKKHKLSADSLFHDFSVKLSFSGSRAVLADSNFWISNDQPRWPNFNTLEESQDFEVYSLDELAYRFYSNGKPDLSSFTGTASAVSIRNNHYQIRFLPNTNSVDSTYIESINESTDSIIWVVSRFTETDRIPTVIKDSTLRAFPTPWRNGPLCFTPLPLNKDYIEIRNRRGNLVEKIKYDKYLHCLEEDEVKSLMAPGIYRFRVGNSGKTKDFIIIY